MRDELQDRVSAAPAGSLLPLPGPWSDPGGLTMSFRQLMDKWHWKPIRHCPGRFVLSTEQFSGPPQELLGLGVECREFRLSTARDPVVVARLDEGGLISYKHRDGAYVHTLNTREGFDRKLIQLGIKPEEM